MMKRIWIIITSILSAIILAFASVLIINMIMTNNSYNPYMKEKNGGKIFYSHRMQIGLSKTLAIAAPTDTLLSVFAMPSGRMSFGKWDYFTIWKAGNQELYSYDVVRMRNDKVLNDTIHSTMINVSFRDDVAPAITYISPESSYTAVFYLNTPYTSSAATVVQEVIVTYSLDGVSVEWVGMQTSDREDDIIMGVPINENNEYSIKNILNDLNSDVETLKVIEAMGYLGDAEFDINNRIAYLDGKENHTALAICVTATYDGIMALRQIRETGKDLTQMKIYPL